LTVGGREAAFAAFVLAAVTMALLMFALAFLIGTAQQRVVEALKAGTQQVKQWSGLVLLLVGGWLIALAVWADFFARIFPV
jgi:hypothetical protein